jgi:AcrR family transcriptional regulator
MTDLHRTVLDASIALIEERGLAKLSLREVARRAGVSHQAPYHHFGSREGLLAALVLEGFEGLSRACDAVPQTSDPAADLAALGQAYITYATSRSGYFRLMFRPDIVHPSDHPQIAQSATQSRAALARVLRRCQDAGLATDLPEDALLQLAWSAVHGAAVLALDGGTPRDAAIDVPHTLSVLIGASPT